MSNMYKSGFAQLIEDMIEFKIALGHKIRWYLLSFDCFCQEYFPTENILDK